MNYCESKAPSGSWESSYLRRSTNVLGRDVRDVGPTEEGFEVRGPVDAGDGRYGPAS